MASVLNCHRLFSCAWPWAWPLTNWIVRPGLSNSTNCWVFHFTPTSASWLNAVETFFSALTRRRLKRGVFRSIVDLQAAINRYIAEHNDDPKPFVWTKTAEAILANTVRIPVPSE